MNPTPSSCCSIGVDVGTGSVRAAAVSDSGVVLASSTHPIATRTVTNNNATTATLLEQSTDDIWAAVAAAVRAVVAALPPDARAAVRGIGFDATCSLAVVREDGSPVAVSPSPSAASSSFEGDGAADAWGDDKWNVVLWADHRAVEEADLINATGSRALRFVGGAMSVEMQLPKILWLKKRMPARLFDACRFFDLPDYLAYRATGASNTRSACSLVCKFGFVPRRACIDDGDDDGDHAADPANAWGWQRDLLAKVGLGSVADKRFVQLGGSFRDDDDDKENGGGGGGRLLTAGTPVADGLCAAAAAELGLPQGLPVGCPVIDAYAGWLGTVGAAAAEEEAAGLGSPSPGRSSGGGAAASMAVIAGTSTCLLLQSPEPAFVDGVWGPYCDAVFPGMWMSEGGQSSTGQLIDFLIDTHPAAGELRRLSALAHDDSHFTTLDRVLDSLAAAAAASSASYLSRHLHVYPDFHGNRSPLADPRMRGVLAGLSLDASVADLAVRYHAAIEALAFQTRQIVERMTRSAADKAGKVRRLCLSGGYVKNRRFVRLLATVCRLPVLLPANEDVSVALGAAVLGMVAGRAVEETEKVERREGTPPSATATASGEMLWRAMTEMAAPGEVVLPDEDPALGRLLDAKYAVFLDMIAAQRRWREQMDEAAATAASS
ncbi:FGGY family of carbohydrate kinase [Zopfochytrium polystomum]|nr:FGGY family of carbohydrate kinase [Zopfochytrium polystomum]